MVTTKKREGIKGTRIPIKLPWKGATNDEDQFAAIKKPVADFLKFKPASKADLTYYVKVKKKDKNGEKVAGTKEVARRRRPGNKTRSIRLLFDPDKKAKIQGKSYSSLQFAITSSVVISEVIDYFETGAGKGLGVIRVIDANSGQGYPIIP